MISAAIRPLSSLHSLAVAVLVALAAMDSYAASVETSAREAILIDATTGAVLLEKNADERMPTASMSKVMTIYMVFERLKNGTLSLDDSFRVSERAWRRGGASSGGSTMFLKLGDKVRVEDLIRGIIVQSGNDASIVIAEGLAGSEEAFAEQMTRRGREIGLRNSNFANASGLPDPNHYMTARDLATLAKRTIDDFPDYYRYYAEVTYVYGGIRQTNRNPLVYKDLGVDGLKTGHTEEAGFGLTASAARSGRRLILVVNGLPSRQARASETERLIDWGFREFNNYALFKGGETVSEAEVWLGQSPKVSLVVEKDLVVTLPRKARTDMKVVVAIQAPVPAPINKGTAVAKLVVKVPGETPIEVPLVAGADVERLGFVGRIAAALKHILWGDSS